MGCLGSYSPYPRWSVGLNSWARLVSVLAMEKLGFTTAMPLLFGAGFNCLSLLLSEDEKRMSYCMLLPTVKLGWQFPWSKGGKFSSAPPHFTGLWFPVSWHYISSKLHYHLSLGFLSHSLLFSLMMSPYLNLLICAMGRTIVPTAKNCEN